jgi:hypothetical protein
LEDSPALPAGARKLTKQSGRFLLVQPQRKRARDFSRINFLDNNGQYFSLVKSNQWTRTRCLLGLLV